MSNGTVGLYVSGTYLIVLFITGFNFWLAIGAAIMAFIICILAPGK